MPATLRSHAAAKKASKSLSASRPVKIPTDSYAWTRYGQKQVKSPEGSRSYFKCKHRACRAKKVESRDQFNSIINIVYKGQHRHDPPKKVILQGDNVLSAAKSLKRKSMSTHGLKEHTIDVVRNDDSATVLNSSPGVRLRSSFTRLQVMPATPTVDADVPEVDQRDTIGSKSLSSSRPVMIPADSYAWTRYGLTQLKSLEGSRSYFKCKHRACRAKKVESRDQFNSIINVVYKGQHEHDPPKEVILKGGKILSTVESRKRKSISNCGLKEHPIEVVHIDDSEIKQRLKKNSPESCVLNQSKKPKFIVHAAAGMKISGDGYKWRKYQQKMVKGNPHPRKYYKCTCAGCTVKKHIEKVVDGSSQVIITYKGLHNHDIPFTQKKTGST